MHDRCSACAQNEATTERISFLSTGDERNVRGFLCLEPKLLRNDDDDDDDGDDDLSLLF